MRWQSRPRGAGSGGGDRYATAAAVAAANFPQGAPAAVLIGDAPSPSSYAAGGLSGALHGLGGVTHGPVLLTATSSVPTATTDALTALGTHTVVILGPSTDVGAAVEAELREDYDVVRIAGTDAFETAVLAAQAMDRGQPAGRPFIGGPAVVIVGATAYADVLASGAFAHRGGLPVLLTDRDQLPAATESLLRELQPQYALTIGGTAAVGDAVVERLRELVPEVIRLAGSDRADTARTMADFMVYTQGTLPDRAVLADGDGSGGGSVDGLVAASMGGAAAGSPVLLSRRGDLDPATRDWLAARCPRLDSVVAIGGSAAVDEATLDTAREAAGRCREQPLMGPTVAARYAERGLDVTISGFSGDNDYCFQVRAGAVEDTDCSYTVPPRGIEVNASYVPEHDLGVVYGTVNGRAATIEVAFDDGTVHRTTPIPLVENGQIWATPGVVRQHLRVRSLSASGETLIEIRL